VKKRTLSCSDDVETHAESYRQTGLEEVGRIGTDKSGLLYVFSAITMASNLATLPKPQLRFCTSHPCPNHRYDCCSEVTHTMLLRDTHPKSLRQIENGRLSPHPQTSTSSN
jgi:hypothetical protein